MSIHLYIIYGSTRAELNSCSRECLAEIYYLALYENFLPTTSLHD